MRFLDAKILTSFAEIWNFLTRNDVLIINCLQNGHWQKSCHPDRRGTRSGGVSFSYWHEISGQTLLKASEFFVLLHYKTHAKICYSPILYPLLRAFSTVGAADL